MTGEAPRDLERLSATITGRVQGVGFRWWVRSAADRMGLTGWVMNGEDERSVELVAEGPPASLDQLERMLRRWLPDIPIVEAGEPHVDPKAMESMLMLGGGGRDLLKKMIRLYLDDAPERIEAIREAMKRGDAMAAARSAHALKAASANLGATALADLSKKLEDTKTDIGWGHQIRSYVLDQSRIKDLRTNVEVGNTQAVLDGDLDGFITASLKQGV